MQFFFKLILYYECNIESAIKELEKNVQSNWAKGRIAVFSPLMAANAFVRRVR